MSFERRSVYCVPLMCGCRGWGKGSVDEYIRAAVTEGFGCCRGVRQELVVLSFVPFDLPF